jgi:hypothetical protein
MTRRGRGRQEGTKDRKKTKSGNAKSNTATRKSAGGGQGAFFVLARAVVLKVL